VSGGGSGGLVLLLLLVGVVLLMNSVGEVGVIWTGVGGNSSLSSNACVIAPAVV